MAKTQKQDYWNRFDALRTSGARGDVDVLRVNPVNLSVPASSSHFDHIIEISRSASTPFPIKSLSEKLNAHRSPRGRGYFGHVGDIIEQLMTNYPTLRWWIEADGLVVDEISSELGPLSAFDLHAGSMAVEHIKNGRLDKDSLLIIAEQLDARGFLLKENLQPAQWRPIAEYNQKHSRTPIRTFAKAVNNPKFSRGVRRRLYVARDRYKMAHRPAEPIDDGY
jgi:hypothetical protein